MIYRHLFFDLDHTLWDHHRNANETLEDLYNDFQLAQLMDGTSSDFIKAFHKINHDLWHRYHQRIIDQAFIRNRRFPMVLESLGVNKIDIPAGLAPEYLIRCPKKPHLMPDTLTVLDYLKPRYEMSIITNGFSDVQDTKLVSSGLDHYFSTVITSEAAGELKPHRQIFDFALKQVKVRKERCIMIGDNPVTDIAGARAAGMDQIYYDPHHLHKAPIATHRVQSLTELCDLL